MERKFGRVMLAGAALAAFLLLGMSGTRDSYAQTSDNKPAKATAVIKPPKLVKSVKAVYPEEAKKQGIKGTVILKATTDVEGKVEDVKVLRSVPSLDQAAIDAVKQWVYEPMVINGTPKPVTFTVAVVFKI